MKHTCVFLPNNTAQQYIILTLKRIINFSKEKITIATSRGMAVRLSCEVVLIARIAKLEKQTLHCYLIQLKLKSENRTKEYNQKDLIISKLQITIPKEKRQTQIYIAVVYHGAVCSVIFTQGCLYIMQEDFSSCMILLSRRRVCG